MASKAFWARKAHSLLLIFLTFSVLTPARAAQNITLRNSFAGSNGAGPNSFVTPGSGNIFYGTTTSGGSSNKGTIFQFNYATNVLTGLASFDGINGDEPYAALTPAGGGLYYGTTIKGGPNNLGTIFQFNSNDNTIILKYAFDSSGGASPLSTLIPAGGGIYYGTANDGGLYGKGGIFEFNSNTGAATLLDSLNSTTGYDTFAAPVSAGNGMYYGTTIKGGANGLGAIYGFNSNTGKVSLKASFDGSNGTRAVDMLVAAGSGIFYGVTEKGGVNDLGGIFEFNSNNSFITLKASFDGTNGTNPSRSLIDLGDGLYYGTTWIGGSNNLGTLFTFNSKTEALELIDSFDGSDGANPSGRLTYAGNGSFIGLAYRGGINNQGVVYSVNTESVPSAPGPLPIVGVYTAIQASRRIRKRIKSASKLQVTKQSNRSA